MARKHAKNAGFLIPDALRPAASRYLPSSVQALLLPASVRQAATGKHIDVAHRAAAHEVFSTWAGKLAKGQLHSLNEGQVEADFTGKLLAALGFVSPADSADQFSMIVKYPVPGVGTADVALGHFRFDADSKAVGPAIVLCELKGAGTDLDKRAHKGRSPVGQAWDYLNATEGASWAIVSNFEEIRLYSRSRGSNYVHRAFLEDLMDVDAFADFYAVFHHHSLLGTGNFLPNAAWMLQQTIEKQETVGKKLYDEYRTRRQDLVRQLQAKGYARDPAIAASQKLLDRVLFIAFAEDRGLLRTSYTLRDTAALEIPTLSPWNSFQFLFRAMDRGDLKRNMPRFNGELFKPDAILDDPAFELDDEWSEVFEGFGEFDFKNEVTVDVLGRIFELSIGDIEALRSDAPEPDLPAGRKQDEKSERRLKGVFYTSPEIVDYLVSAALQPAFDAERARIATLHDFDPDSPDTPPAAFTRDLIAALDAMTFCDPACGSGAFLNGAYNWFEDARVALLKDLHDADPDDPACTGVAADWRERSAPMILRNNLFGVDLSFESVEIARLSLWIRTACRTQILAPLADNVVRGNSVVDDPEVDKDHAFRWRERFARVFERGGFDAVVGNPPYVRQERLGAIKPHLQANYAGYHGMADLYVYFYERGLSLLKPGGRLAYVVTNKWMKAGYGEPLRKLFSESAWVESVVDFGHAKQFFKDADVFPCFLVARKPNDDAPPATASVCAVPRELVDLKGLKAQVGTRSIRVERDRLTSEAWQLEPRAVGDLMDKIRRNGVPLAEYAGVKPYYGIKTGFNEAFLIDTATKDRLVREDPKSAEVLKPYLRGQDIKRWSPEWAGLWMIFTRRGIDIDAYPAIKRHLETFRAGLEPMPKDWDRKVEWPGRKEGTYAWYEIQDSIDYWESFAEEKIVYQEIQFHPNYSRDRVGYFGNNKVFIIPKFDHSLLAILNSPLMWCFNWRYLPHMKDEALSPVGFLMEALPIARVSEVRQPHLIDVVDRMCEIVRSNVSARTDLLDWLKVEHQVPEPNTKLQNPIALDSDGFVNEVKKARGKTGLSAAGLKALREEFARTIEPAKLLKAEADALERQLHDLVNEAYGLTPEEVRLMWDTAPPRMPIPRPPGV